MTVWTPEPLRNYDKKQHRRFVDAFKSRQGDRPWVAVSGSVNDGKVSLIVEVSPTLTEKLPADRLMHRLLPIIDGRGGGRKDRAEAGGRHPERLETLYEEARRVVREELEGAR